MSALHTAIAIAAAVSIAVNVLILALCRVASISDDWHMQAALHAHSQDETHGNPELHDFN